MINKELLIVSFGLAICVTAYNRNHTVNASHVIPTMVETNSRTRFWDPPPKFGKPLLDLSFVPKSKTNGRMNDVFSKKITTDLVESGETFIQEGINSTKYKVVKGDNTSGKSHQNMDQKGIGSGNDTENFDLVENLQRKKPVINAIVSPLTKTSVAFVNTIFRKLLPYNSRGQGSAQINGKQQTEDNEHMASDYSYYYKDNKTKIQKNVETSNNLNREKVNVANKENGRRTDMETLLVRGDYSVNTPTMFHNCSCLHDTIGIRDRDCCSGIINNSLSLNETTRANEFVPKFETCWNISLSELVNQDLREVSETIYTHALQFSSCEKTDTADNKILIISLCPKEQSIDKSVKNKCENLTSPLLPPVTLKLLSGALTFRNAFCAHCHGFHDTPLEVWQIAINCEKNITNSFVSLHISDLVTLVKSGACHVIFSVPAGNIKLRSCCEPGDWVNDTRNSSFSSAECIRVDTVQCKSYLLPIPVNQTCQCLKCEGINSHFIFEAIPGQVIKTSVLKIDNSPIHRYTSGGILIILDATGRYSQGTTILYLCKDTQVFDRFSAGCTELVCPLWSEPYRGRCYNVRNTYFMENSTQIFPTGWKNLDVLLTVTRPLDNDWCFRFLQLLNVWRKFIKRVSIDELEYQMKKKQKDNFGFGNCKWVKKQESKSGNLTVSITLRNNNVNLDFVNRLKQMVNSIVSADSNVTQISLTNMNNLTQWISCLDGNSPKQRKGLRLIEVKEVVYAVLNMTDVSIHYPLINIGYGLIKHELFNISETFSETVFICETSQLFFRKDCTVVLYNLSETFQNGSQLEILSSGQIYHERDFEIQGIQVFVCSKFQFERQNQKQNKAYVILSAIMATLSGICLLLTLLIYCMFPEIRTLPGKMTASLALTLLLTLISNTTSFVELHHDYICPILAVITHVITLAYFGWMSAIAVNMALTFGPGVKTFVKTSEARPLFRRYNLVVWGSSVTIVMSSAILDFIHLEPSQSPGVSNPTNVPTPPSAQPYVTSLLSASYSPSPFSTEYPRYGFPFCTWFSGPLWSKLAFIIIPYIVTFIINLIGFIITVIGLERSRKLSQKLGRKPTDRTQCLIYIKLSTAMGFSWILSILTNIYPDCEVLPYIYMSLVLLQGVCLFLAFMVNKRVYTLIRATISCNKQTHSNIVTKNCEIKTESSKNI